MPSFLHNYKDSLVGIDSDRYIKKIELCGGVDPYLLDETKISKDVNLWPKVTNMDIVNYLVLTTNSVTMSQMKSYKALEAHNFFTSGWVNPDFSMVELPNKNIILLGKVGHSQSLNLPPLKLWILSKPDGEILTAHCNCMAGLGEACSHIGATLFALEYGNQVQDSVTCTSKPNKWLPPHMKKVPYSPVSEIDFSSANSKKRKLSQPQAAQCGTKKTDIPAPTQEEIAEFYINLAAAGDGNSAILSLIPEHSDKFVPHRDPVLPMSLTTLFNEAATKLQFNELLANSETAFDSLTISDSVAIAIENATREQANSKQWFDQRAGRITASKMHAACHTDPTNPSVSLIKSICYPGHNNFKTDATTWGCNNEDVARQAYTAYMINNHDGMSVSKTGLFINPECPYIGASPDSIVECNCCGKGVLEVKCPYSHRNLTVNEMCLQANSCLSNKNGDATLKHSHPYYSQVQTQMAVCNTEYCDFVVWSLNDMHIERVERSRDFWNDNLVIANHFYKVAILPELLAKWFSALKHTSLHPDTPERAVDSICYCKEREHQPMVVCSNSACLYKKFHWECLKIKAKPKAKNWLCPECKKSCRMTKNKE